MFAILRFVGLLNAAVWLGGAVFFSLVAAPGIFQPEMKATFKDYYVGVIAQMMQARYFNFHLVCGGIALLHTLAFWLARRRESQRVVVWTLAVICALNLAGAFVLQPQLRSLFQTKYTAPTVPQRTQAAASFPRWHGVSQVFNLLVLGGLVFYAWRLTGPGPDSRYAAKTNPFAGGANTERVG